MYTFEVFNTIWSSHVASTSKKIDSEWEINVLFGYILLVVKPFSQDEVFASARRNSHGITPRRG